MLNTFQKKRNIICIALNIGAAFRFTTKMKTLSLPPLSVLNYMQDRYPIQQYPIHFKLVIGLSNRYGIKKIDNDPGVKWLADFLKTIYQQYY